MKLNQALEIIQLTDVGHRRDHNEDAIACDADLGLVVLADGMGGYNAGEVASEIAVLSIARDIKEGMSHVQQGQLDLLLDVQTEQQLIIDAVQNANVTIYNVAQSQPQYAGMGTTLVLGLFAHNQLLVGHIGDSRMYRLRQQQLTRLTDDHSLLQEQIKAGLISEAQAKHSANKNLVTRALGIDPEVSLELNQFDTEVDDIYLLCSDGLSDLIDDHVIGETLNMLSSDLPKTAQTFVDMANALGGHDNISVILVRINPLFTHQRAWYHHFLNWLK